MIPKLLHFIWLGPVNPPIQTINSWKENHIGWNIKLWREDDLKSLQMINRDIFNKVKKRRYNQLSDIARLEILYQFGGVYVDADIMCYKCLDDKMMENKTFMVVEKLNLISNSIIGSYPNNPLIYDLIMQLKKTWEPTIPVWKSTGPLFITEYLRNNGIVQIDRHKVCSTGKIKIYPYYYINFMIDTIKKCTWRPLESKTIVSTKDRKYITSGNMIEWDKIYGIQLWFGGKPNNYRRKLDTVLINQNIEFYIKELRKDLGI